MEDLKKIGKCHRNAAADVVILFFLCQLFGVMVPLVVTPWCSRAFAFPPHLGLRDRKGCGARPGKNIP